MGPITIFGITIAGSAAMGGLVMAERYVKSTLGPYIKDIFSGSKDIPPTKQIIPTKQLRILGLPNSGKTQFINALRRKPNPTEKKQTFGVEDIPEFIFMNFGIRQPLHTKDANGATEYLRKTIRQFVKESDYVLFMCDIAQYLDAKEQEYRDNNNAIIRAIQELSNKTSKKICIILSHADELKKLHLSEQEGLCKFKEAIQLTPYRNIPCYTINTNEQDDVRNLFQKILQQL